MKTIKLQEVAIISIFILAVAFGVTYKYWLE